MSCLFITIASLTFVPQPSVPESNTGSSISLILDNEKAPEKPPSPPNTSGRIVFLTCSLINSTDLYPASKLTPAAA